MEIDDIEQLHNEAYLHEFLDGFAIIESIKENFTNKLYPACILVV